MLFAARIACEDLLRSREKKKEKERKGEGVYRKRVSCFSWISSLPEHSVVYATHIKEGVSAVSRLKKRATSIYAVSNIGFTSRSLTFVYTKIHICIHICTRFANTARPKKKLRSSSNNKQKLNMHLRVGKKKKHKKRKQYKPRHANTGRELQKRERKGKE